MNVLRRVDGDCVAEGEGLVEVTGLDGLGQARVVLAQGNCGDVREHVEQQVAVRVCDLVAHALFVVHVELQREVVDRHCFAFFFKFG